MNVHACNVCRTIENHVAFIESCEGCGLRHGAPVMLTETRQLIGRNGPVHAIVIHGRAVDRVAELEAKAKETGGKADLRNMNPASRWRIAAWCEACRRRLVEIVRERGEFIPFFPRSTVEEFVAIRNKESGELAAWNRERDQRLNRFAAMANRNGLRVAKPKPAFAEAD